MKERLQNPNPELTEQIVNGWKQITIDDFRRAVKRAVKADVPTVIDVPINPEENVLPMIPPGMGLKDTLWEAD